MKKQLIVATVAVLAASPARTAENCTACCTPKAAQPGIAVEPFGKLPNGTAVSLYTLTNARGATVKITNYGGIVTSLKVPDRKGKLGDVVLGYDNLEGYLKSTPYFGAITGRYANRIAKGKFTIDGKGYSLPINNKPNALHGGLKGFDKRVWEAKTMKTRRGPALSLRYLSVNTEEGYPGNLWNHVTYTLTNDNALRIDYSAMTDKKTVLNLTHHSYFNLKGEGSGDILGHKVMLNASRFTPVDATLIPTGKLQKVKGTPFDFTKYHAIGERIGGKDEQLTRGKGYDHNFIVDGKGFRLAARVHEPQSGRLMSVFSTEPGIQLYTGNFLDGTITGKSGQKYNFRNGFCLENQHFPDSPNQPKFPTTLLSPGKVYRQTTIYQFSAR